MSRHNLRRPVAEQRLGEIDRMLPRLTCWAAVLDEAIATEKAALATLFDERPPANQPEHPRDEDARTAEMRERNGRVNIYQLGARDRWDRAGALEPLARAAGMTPVDGETDSSAGLGGLTVTRARLAEMQSERAALVAELAALDAAAAPVAVPVAVAHTPAPTTAKAAARR